MVVHLTSRLSELGSDPGKTIVQTCPLTGKGENSRTCSMRVGSLYNHVGLDQYRVGEGS